MCLWQYSRQYRIGMCYDTTVNNKGLECVYDNTVGNKGLECVYDDNSIQ